MSKALEEKNKTLVLEAFDTLFNHRRKWALPILRNLIRRETVRFNELKKLIPDIASTVLSHTLVVLEHQGLASKKVYPEIPPRVEYKLTDRSRELEVILDELHIWAQRWKFSRIDTRTISPLVRQSKYEQRTGHSDEQGVMTQARKENPSVLTQG